MEHYSVMLKECIEGLNIKADGIYVDGTLGRAGHSKEILKRLSTGHLYSFDLDTQAIEESETILSQISNNFTLIHSNFIYMKEQLEKRGVEKVDGILLDLGVSSPQFDDPERGFSYRYNTRLDMRMNQQQELDAYKIVNEYSFNDLVRILSHYGEEKYAKNIARKIEKVRAISPIETTGQLVEIIKSALPAKELSKKGHPAKQTFQALRIEVNGELDNLKEVISTSLEMLKPSGRLVILTFHSLEDEIVKKMFKEASSIPQIDSRIPIKEKDLPQADYILVNKKVITACDEELIINHRSHSAKLRIIERR